MLLWPSSKKSRVGAFAQKPAPPDALSWRRRWSQRGLLALAFVVLVAGMTRPPAREDALLSQDIDTQPVAKDTISAAFDFESEDLKATRDAREAAAAAVPLTYRVQPEPVRAQLDELARRIDAVRALLPRVEAAVREALLASTEDQAPHMIAENAVNTFAEAHIGETPLDPEREASLLATWLMPDTASLPQRIFEEPATEESNGRERRREEPGPRKTAGLAEAAAPMLFSQADLLENLSVAALEYVLASGVRDAAVPADRLEQRMLLVRDRAVAGVRPSEETTLKNLPGPSEAQEALSSRLTQSAQQLAGDQPWARYQAAAMALAAPLLAPNVEYDDVSTEEARQRARAEAAPVMRQILAGEVIQRAGARWTPQTRSDVKSYLALVQTEREPYSRILAQLAANALLTGLVLVCLKRALYVFSPLPRRERMKLWNAGLLLLAGTVLLARLVYYFEPTGFAVPVAASAILFAILGNTRAAALYSLLSAAMVSTVYGYDWRVVVVHSAMSLAGTFGIYNVRRRSDMTNACIQAGAFGLLAGVAVLLATGSFNSDVALRQLLVIAFNGVVVLFLVPGLLPPLERLFGAVTDIQLLEYSDLNNELLAKLALEVPGTFSHSLMLGQLAEAAAEAIGANGLKARVCAYYHDIGKMKRPAYFSENQAGFNIHDELTPRLSARAIASHVTAGVELAREYHLPQPIIDGIREHHGTTLIGYFYKQAMDAQKHGDVREEDFRYPGPRPQSRETAILMICDAVESGTRSIKNPNEERVREFVDKIIAARSADRQFDECNLTLRDLDTLAAVISKRMLAALHGRVAYPDLKTREETESLVSEPRLRQASEPGAAPAAAAPGGVA